MRGRHQRANHTYALRSDPLARWCGILAIAGVAGSWLAILAVPQIPGHMGYVVHYTTTFGIDALGSWRQLMRLPLTGTILVAVNMVLAILLSGGRESRSSDHACDVPHAALVLFVAAVLVSFAVLLGSVLLWSINT